MRIESHSHATRDRKESSPFTFLPAAILTFGALPFLAQNATAADERPEATPAEGAFIRAESTVGAAFVNGIGGAPATDAHDWSPFADGFKNALDKPGAGWTVRSLQWGEERGRDDYEEALDHDGIRENLKSLIRDELLTRFENHITMLERLHRGIYPIS
jgi:hypothetical protein